MQTVAPTPWGTRGTCPPTFTNGWARGTPRVEEQQKETDQIVLTSRKHSPKRFIVLLRGQKVERDQKKFPALCAGPVPPTFKFVPAPLNADKDCAGNNIEP